MMIGDEVPASKAKEQKMEIVDNFFVETEQDNQVEVEKRAVMRDGRVPMMQKNLVKKEQREIEQQRKKEGWVLEQEAIKIEEARQLRAQRPMKIKASSYTNVKSSAAPVVQAQQ